MRPKRKKVIIQGHHRRHSDRNVRSRTSMLLTDEHLEGCMQIAATETECGVESLSNQKQCLISH